MTPPPPSPRKPREPIVLTVQRTERLTPHLIRIVFGGPGADAFTDNEFTDHYVKLHFPGAVRTYTVRSFDAAARELTIDFVYHGDQGVAGPWAAAAKPGDELALLGPGGAYAPDPTAGWHLLVGDESAIPAIAAALERLPFDAHARVGIEVGSSADELKLYTPADAEIRWLHRGEVMPGSTSLLIDFVRSLRIADDTVHVFAHGEGHTIMKQLRPYLFNECGLAPDRVSISGYWRQGRTEEEFRAWKTQLRAEDEAGTAG